MKHHDTGGIGEDRTLKDILDRHMRLVHITNAHHIEIDGMIGSVQIDYTAISPMWIPGRKCEKHLSRPWHMAARYLNRKRNMPQRNLEKQNRAGRFMKSWRQRKARWQSSRPKSQQMQKVSRHLYKNREVPTVYAVGILFPGKDNDMEEKEVVLESVEQFQEYLKENADDKSIVSVVLELAGNGTDTEGGDQNG